MSYSFNQDEFPSPCGEVVMKQQFFEEVLRCTISFPSPCGEVVMKLFAQKAQGEYHGVY